MWCPLEAPSPTVRARFAEKPQPVQARITATFTGPSHAQNARPVRMFSIPITAATSVIGRLGRTSGDETHRRLLLCGALCTERQAAVVGRRVEPSGPVVVVPPGRAAACAAAGCTSRGAPRPARSWCCRASAPELSLPGVGAQYCVFYKRAKTALAALVQAPGWQETHRANAIRCERRDEGP